MGILVGLQFGQGEPEFCGLGNGLDSLVEQSSGIIWVLHGDGFPPEVHIVLNVLECFLEDLALEFGVLLLVGRLHPQLD